MKSFCTWCGSEEKRIQDNIPRFFHPETGKPIYHVGYFCTNINCKRGCGNIKGHQYDNILFQWFRGYRQCSLCGYKLHINDGT